MSTQKQIIDGLRDIIADVPKKSYDYFVAETPVKSGNARRSTRLRDTTIKADYAYAHRLDTGWSSQAPDGMVDPTIAYMEKLIADNVRKY